MGRKRQLSSEDAVLGTQPSSQKAVKQLKMDNFVEATNNSPIVNSPDRSPHPSEMVDLERFSPLTRGLIKDLIAEQMGQAPTFRTAPQENSLSDLMLQHISAVAADVKQILSLLQSIFPS